MGEKIAAEKKVAENKVAMKKKVQQAKRKTRSKSRQQPKENPVTLHDIEDLHNEWFAARAEDDVDASRLALNKLRQARQRYAVNNKSVKKPSDWARKVHK